ncbi:phosphoglycerate mutase-like protein [Anaeromyces robustus]|uniref:Phosphoglycerate mutase-like protein n=1 Tax=Anaeromyces robustus TaxID=1754192 RepID=A0A1Y1X6T0_9FUNG|nr:phosphoglycerate mutase-like protein [Anaeromyces robustus]|eukprot:ORX81096.1 phosphoglycerate mutase-like protein [Anaeromyces robustus]
MVKEIWIIRHGQSLANSGEKTSIPSTIPLSPIGHQQAEKLLTQVINKPELIVVSPYLRTQQTSKPVCNKYNDTPVETWPIQEFTYIEPSRCCNTTTEERRPLVLEYWKKRDPYYQDGENAESFFMLYERVRSMFKKLKELDENKYHYIVLFCHGQFMRATQVYVENPNFTIEEAMNAYCDKTEKSEIKNTQIDKYSIDNNIIKKLN